MSALTYVSMLLLLCVSLATNAQNYGPGSWIMVGGTNTDTPPYNLLYYKILEVKNSNDRYASIVDVSIQADANYFEKQGTFRIRIDKFEGTPARFDGIEIKCISGNPGIAKFYVFNNAIWVRANYLWGNIFCKPEGTFAGSSPLSGTPVGTTAEPSGFITFAETFGLKCDFDNNQFFKLPYTNPSGDYYVAGRMGVGVPHAYNTLVLPNNGSVAWKHTNGENEIIGINSNANNDFTVYAGGPDRLYIKSASGNVGIGTTNPGEYKLAVEGTIGARKVRVTSLAWADFVFEEQYKLMPLDELQRFIATNKHLPDIPSAREVEKNGIDLGDINAKLLQKIEEQTLYILELNKKLEDITRRLTHVEKNAPDKTLPKR